MQTVYDAAGGGPAFLRLAAANHARCLADPELEHAFAHEGHPEHVQRLAAYWGEVFGGPATYSGTCGGHSGMLALHAGTGAGADWGARFAACFRGAVEDAGLSCDPALRAVLHAYIDDAVAEVVAVSPVGATAAPGLPVPRWGWSGEEPG